MKLKFYFLPFIFFILTNCSTYKDANSSLVSGDFHNAFTLSYDKYIKSPTEKNGIKFLPLIYDSYSKAQKADEARLKEIQNLSNPSKYEEAYILINNLQDRQKCIVGIDGKSINGKRTNFNLKDYSLAFKEIQEKYADFLYNEGQSFLALNDKNGGQDAYYRFKKLESIYPNYKDTRNLINVAKEQGTYKVFVQLSNNTNVVIPIMLERDLLNFNSYGLDKQWAEFYTGNPNYAYDYTIQLSFERVFVSPEKEKVEVHKFEKEIVDGQTELIKNGEKVKDENGKVIMVDKYITVKSKFEEIYRVKEAIILARYYLINNNKDEQVISKELSSNFVFSNYVGNYTGDKRALDKDYLKMLDNRVIPFPSNEQMIFDCGHDLKLKLKREIKNIF